jgi:hypothetical protein
VHIAFSSKVFLYSPMCFFFTLIPEWLRPSVYLRRDEIDESCYSNNVNVVVSSFENEFSPFLLRNCVGGGRWKREEKGKTQAQKI